jgi:TonB family protein
LSDPHWQKLLRELADELAMRRTPRLLMMPDAVMPLAFGLFRPTILLPAGCLHWTEMRKRIVLVHELTHIRRRDGISQLFANVVAALWWFQPLAWLARKRLRQESEHACDAQVLAIGVRASDYATQLVDIARTSRLTLLSRAAICMARKDELEPRLVRILAPQRAGSFLRAFVSATLVIAIAATAPAITLRRNHSNIGGSHMKRTLLTGLLATATLSAATISGSLFDTTGVAIPDAKLVLHSADTSADLDTTSGPDGKFSFGDLSAGQYILRVEKPGFNDLLREFTVKQDSNIERGLVMQVKGVEEKPQADSSSHMAQPFAPDRIRVKGDVAEANLIRKVQPVYPAAAKAAHVQGTVLLQMIILKDGTPGEITVTSSPSNDLSQASIDAVRQWRYRPILLNGQPVQVVTQVIVNYTLSQ